MIDANPSADTVLDAVPESLTREPLAVGEVVYDWNIVTDSISWGPGFAAVLGVADPGSVATGLGYAEHLSADSPSSRFEAIMSHGGCDTGGGVPYKTVYGLVASKRAKSQPVWIEDIGRWFADANDRPCRAHGVVRDITKRYEAERRTIQIAQRDPETDTYTRAHFIEHIARQISVATRKASATFAILLIGLEPADVEAPPVRDDLIACVTALRETMRTNEIIARYAPTRFAVLLENCNDSQAAAAAERLLGVVAACRTAAPMRARIGAVIAPCHGRTPQALLQFAEEALEAARQPNAAPFVRYDPSAPRVRVASEGTSDEILSALNEGRVHLALQPIVDAKSHAIAFYEGLVRVQRANGATLMPDALVPNAEKTGLVPLIDRRVIDLAFAHLTEDPEIAISINASAWSLQDAFWFDHLRAACKLRPAAARRLTIEITETCAIADIEMTRSTLAAIKPLGVKIALDDFGSGHSSFRNLRKLPIDYLKIDGAFAQNLATSSDDRFFIRTLIDLARNLRIPTVAEWVEDAETAKILADWGVDYLQGHLFGKAVIKPVATLRRRRERA